MSRVINQKNSTFVAGAAGPVDRVLVRAQAQRILFAETLARLELLALELPFKSLDLRYVNVWRNQNFESIEGLLRPFLDYAGLRVEYCVHGYDDTLSFAQWSQAEVEVLWLDSSRYAARMTFDEWSDWLRARLLELRAKTTAPILVASWDAWTDSTASSLQGLLSEGIPGVYVADLRAACNEENVVLLDPRVAKVSGSPVSRPAQAVLARCLGCLWLPALLLPPVKAVAVDLDNTLHAGILGEDGAEGVLLYEGHIILQQALQALRARGVFLALISRNECEDVETLFAQRKDYPLRWEDFSVIDVSWGSKADALLRVAQQLRIAPDALLFIDDNPGELASVAAGCPGVQTLFAHPEGMQTCQALRYYPGLWRWLVSADDARRVEDMKANAERDQLSRTAGDEDQYFRQLGVTLTLRYDAAADIPRLADLCCKTNQFNLVLRRYVEADLATFMARDDACVASVSLADRLSDSGTIAVLVAVREHDTLTIEELCVSCRALGRRLEDTIVSSAILGMYLLSGCRRVRFRAALGPRNQPARDWLDGLVGRLSGMPLVGSEMEAQLFACFSPPLGVTVVQE